MTTAIVPSTAPANLTTTLASYLDKHFVVHILSHLKRNLVAAQSQSQSPSSSPSNENKEDNKEDNNHEEDANDEEKQQLLNNNKNKNNNENRIANLTTMQQQWLASIEKAQYSIISNSRLLDEQILFLEQRMLNISDEDEANLNYKRSLNKRCTKLNEQKKQLSKKMQYLESQCMPLLTILNKLSMTSHLTNQTLNMNMLINDFQFDEEAFNFDLFFNYCQLRYETGIYENTDDLLQCYQLLTKNREKRYRSLWGKFAIEILLNKWENAIASMREIREFIEAEHRTLTRLKKDDEDEEEKNKNTDNYNPKNNTGDADDSDASADEDGADELGMDGEAANPDDATASKKAAEKANKQLARQQRDAARMNRARYVSKQISLLMRDRAWLLHWSLFVYFSRDSLLDELISLFMDIKFVNVIQTICPHLLRYLTAAIIISTTVDRSLKMKYLTDVCRVIFEERYTYKDAITEYVRLLIRGNDFAAASAMLSSAMSIVCSDFFLSYYRYYFLEYARTVFVKKYCRLYSIINVEHLAKLLLMIDEHGVATNDAADEDWTMDKIQQWLINALKLEKIEARLDVVKNVLYVHFAESNPYQALVDQTRNMNRRTFALFAELNESKYRDIDLPI